jgi:hypothetical protein
MAPDYWWENSAITGIEELVSTAYIPHLAKIAVPAGQSELLNAESMAEYVRKV